MKSLIFCASGNPLFYNERYKDSDHWRWTTNDRDYETVVYRYNDFAIEPNSYDALKQGTGYKWQIARQFFEDHKDEFSKYEYIGFMDDDLVTDYKSINRAIMVAREAQLGLWQPSTIAGSDSTHRILHQKPFVKYTTTSFVEGMAPFIHSSHMSLFIKLFEYHDFKSGWGLDLALSDLLKAKTGVIHEVGMYHPAKISYYDKQAAFEEMYYIFNVIYPKFIKDVYDESVGSYNGQPREFEISLRME